VRFAVIGIFFSDADKFLRIFIAIFFAGIPLTPEGGAIAS